jgi:ribosomal protein S18 acetylase RimI-like enzyme
MTFPLITVEQPPAAGDIAVIARGMREYALAQIEGDESSPVACFAKEDDVIVGGIVGRIIKRRMFVDLLWVDEKRRNRGVGSSLLQAMESVAVARGCHDVLLETLSQSAAHLYTSAGYRLMSRIPEYIPGFAKHVLLKSLEHSG